MTTLLIAGLAISVALFALGVACVCDEELKGIEI